MKAISHIATLTMVILTIITSSCTTTDLTSEILSSTTPDSVFTRDGLIKRDRKASTFVRVNLENLEHDMVVAQGEYLASISSLLEIPLDNREEFFMIAQELYPILFTSDRPTSDEMLTAVTQISASPIEPLAVKIVE